MRLHRMLVRRIRRIAALLVLGHGDGHDSQWATPGILEAMKPGRMPGHGGTEEVPG